MSGLAYLPLELALSVVEHATWESEPWQLPWVASLRLISRAFDRVVAPVLFETVEIPDDNIAALICIARQTNSPLRMTLRVLFLPHTYMDLRPEHDLAALVSTLERVQDFTGPHIFFTRFHACLGDRRLSSVFLVDPVNLWTQQVFERSSSHNDTVGYLHLIVATTDVEGNIRNPNLTRISAPYVIVDAFSLAPFERERNEREFAAFTQELAKLFRRPTLRRLLIRIRVRSLEARTLLDVIIQRWAAETRDERVWLDDSSPVALPLSSDESIFDGFDRGDVYRGRGLWMTGRQLYTSREE
ncbi:hypothetical protein EXIGLDRAFT_775329 [Exidia glandulosa HHB12029]|uniref:F-box domain-containing protein n=1 Tax=Exidia glandulosa HHB12029 TaxID=1314781 RepID=A0A165DYJ0_EXIGL|nr:hypothetical protein EXIGLDRAFT_775329 [Exidia glandulosa HHB12029]